MPHGRPWLEGCGLVVDLEVDEVSFVTVDALSNLFAWRLVAEGGRKCTVI